MFHHLILFIALRPGDFDTRHRKRKDQTDLFPQSWYTPDKYKLDARWPIVYCANGATTILWFFFWICKKHIKLFAGTLCHLADGIAFSLITLIEYMLASICRAHTVCCGENMYFASSPFLSVLVFINNCVCVKTYKWNARIAYVTRRETSDIIKIISLASF
jgi:hypothetical protein